MAKVELLLMVAVLIRSVMNATGQPLLENPTIDVCEGQRNCFASVQNNTSITCAARGVRSPSNVQWFQKTLLGEKPIESLHFNDTVNDTYVSLARTHATFTLNSVLELYICRLVNSATSPGDGVAMVLLELSQTYYRWKSNVSASGHVDQEVVLQCTDSDNSALLWKKRTESGEYDTLAYGMDGWPFLMTEEYNLTSNGSLIIPRLTRQYEGEYVCLYNSPEQQGYNAFSLEVDGSSPPDEPDGLSPAAMWIIILIVVVVGVAMILILVYMRARRQKQGYSDQLQRTESLEKGPKIKRKRDTWNKAAGFLMSDKAPESTTDVLEIESNSSEVAEEIPEMSTFKSSTEDVGEAASSDSPNTDLVNAKESDESTKGETVDSEPVLVTEDPESDEEDDVAVTQNSKPKAVVTEISELDQPQDVLTLGTLIIVLLESAIKSFTWEGKEVNSFQQETFKPFAGAAYHRKVYVADRGGKSIVKFDKNLNRLQEFGSEHLADPGCLTISRANNYLFVLNGKDEPNAVISVFSLDGKHIKNIRLRDLAEPWFIKCNTKNEMLVSEFNSKKVKIFDIEKEKMTDSFSTNLDGAPMYSRGLAVDQDNNIYVSVRAPGLRSQMECIVKYNSQGFQLKKYLESPPANQSLKRFWKSVPLGRHIDGIAEDVLAVGRKSKGLDFATGVHFVEQWDEEYLLVVDTGNKRVLIVQLTLDTTTQF